MERKKISRTKKRYSRKSVISKKKKYSRKSKSKSKKRGGTNEFPAPSIQTWEDADAILRGLIENEDDGIMKEFDDLKISGDSGCNVAVANFISGGGKNKKRQGSKKKKKRSKKKGGNKTMFQWDENKTPILLNMIEFFKRATQTLSVLFLQAYPQVMHIVGYFTASTILSQMESILQGVIYCGIGVMVGMTTTNIGAIMLAVSTISGIAGLYRELRQTPHLQDVHAHFLCATTAVRSSYRTMFQDMINHAGAGGALLADGGNKVSEFIAVNITEIIVNNVYNFGPRGKIAAMAFERTDYTPPPIITLFDPTSSAISVDKNSLTNRDHWKFNISVIKLEEEREEAAGMRARIQAIMTLSTAASKSLKQNTQRVEEKRKLPNKLAVRSSLNKKIPRKMSDKGSLAKANKKAMALAATSSAPASSPQGFSFGTGQPAAQQPAAQNPMFIVP